MTRRKAAVRGPMAAIAGTGVPSESRGPRRRDGMSPGMDLR